jgi:hypothetical protein
MEGGERQVLRGAINAIGKEKDTTRGILEGMDTKAIKKHYNYKYRSILEKIKTNRTS